MQALKTVFAAAALTTFLAPAAHADEWNKRTYLTFSAPVQIPGATLPAGTYTFELAAPDTSRHVIRVSEKDTNKPIGLFMTIPNERLDPPSDNLILFSERAAGSPQAIQVWFYPGDRAGEEFVYPKSQAMRIAKANKRPVLATADDNSKRSEADRMAAMRGASVGRVDESGKMTDESKSTSTTARTETTPRSETTPRAETTPSTTARSQTTGTTAAPANTVDGRNARARSTTAQPNTGVGTTGTSASRRRRELPRTASNLVALELLSALSLAGGFAARRLRLSR